MKPYAIRRNIKLFPWYRFFIDFRPTYPVMLVFVSGITGSYTMGMAFMTVLLFSQALFEIPTGTFSDKLGRRKTLLCGIVIDIIANISFGISALYSNIPGIALSSFIQGIAYSFYSGTEDAVLYETAEQLRMKNKYNTVYGKVNAMSQISMASSAVLGGFLADFISFPVTAFSTVVTLSIGFAVTFFLIEPAKHSYSEDRRHYIGHIKQAAGLLQKNRKLRLYAIGEIINSGCGWASHSFQSLYIQTLVPLWVMGIVRMIKQVLGALSFWFSGFFAKRLGNMQLLLWSNILSRLVLFIALLINSALSPFILAATNLFYGTAQTSASHLMQEEFSDKERATMGSLISLCGSIAFGLGCLVLGYIADLTSPLTALYIALAGHTTVIWVYYKIFRSTDAVSE